MQYMGSKSKHAKDLLPIILKDHTPDMWYIEPFVGGCNMIDKVDPAVAPKRLGCDVHDYLISMWQAVKKGWMPPELISEESYKDVKNNKDHYPKELVAYVGFAISFGGKWFGGYSKNKRGDDYIAAAYKRSLKQFPKILDVNFQNKSVFDIDFTRCGKATIYCDPPYAGTTKYKDDFDHERFYQWCRDRHNEGHKVFVSEYNMPDDFICVWSKEVKMNMSKRSNTDVRVEKLFTLK